MYPRVGAGKRPGSGIPARLPLELGLELLEPCEGGLVEVAERVPVAGVSLDALDRKRRRRAPPAVRPRALRRQCG